MSDILIKGMEMPTNCCQCPVNMEICKRGYKYLLEHPELYDKRADDCPLIPVPPHGDLIERDALIDDLKRQCKEVFRIDAVSPEDFWINRNEAYRQRLWQTWCEGFYEYVGSRPTIIPAEEEWA